MSGPDVVIKSESASAIVRFLDTGLAVVSNVIALDPERGHGTAVMKLVCDYADKWNITLLLSVQAYGKPAATMNNRLLEDWYQSFGFARQPEYTRPPWRMIRRPRRNYTAPNEKSDRPSDPSNREI